MLKRLALFLLLISFFVIAPSSEAQIKIMPLGDSITEISSSYRYDLYCMLKKDGLNIDFVGSNIYSSDAANRPSNCIVDGVNLGFGWDKNQEGHSGWTTGGVAGELQGWVNTYRPDYVLLHIGANDLLGSPTHYFDDPWGNLGIYTIFRGNQTPAANVVYPPKGPSIKGMLKTIKDANPNARIVIAKHIPLRDFSTTQLNSIIQRVYDEEKNNYNLYLADMTVGYSASQDNYDGIHPNDDGGRKMANAWYQVLRPLLAGQPAPTLPPGVSPTMTPTPTRIPTVIPLNINQFYKGININGEAVTIEGRQWLAEVNADVTVDSNRFRDPSTPLNPPAPAGVEAMIRGASWGRDGKPIIYVNNVPNGTYGVYIYIWEDNSTQIVNFSVQDRIVAQNISSGPPGSWAKLGPFPAVVTNGRIKVNAFGSGDANISGIEIWTANGTTITASNTPTLGPTPNPIQNLSMKGLKVIGNKVVNENGQNVRLIGVNISGTEYSCIGSSGIDTMPWGIFEVPPTQETINGLKKWNVNTVRVPLNESCWLGFDPDRSANFNTVRGNEYLGKYAQFSGDNYKTAIMNWVNLLTQNNIAVVLEIHWSAPGKFLARGQSPMLNRANSIRVWEDIAQRFKTNSSVIFDLHNEPFYHIWDGQQQRVRGGSWNENSSDAVWSCWKNGSGPGRNCTGVNNWYDMENRVYKDTNHYEFEVAGMEELVTAVRGTGANNIIMLSGMMFANNLTKFLQYKPSDTNIIASTHTYNGNDCKTESCWNNTFKPIADVMPLIAGEIGMKERDWENQPADMNFVDNISKFYDANGIHYLAWTWNTWGCDGHQLISNFDGTVNRGCRHSEDLYRAMQNSLATHNPGGPITPTVTRTPTPTTQTPTSQVPTSVVSITPSPTTQVSLTQVPTEVPTIALPTTPPDCENKQLGDADCDSKTSLVDYELLRRGIASGNLNADFNKDGKVTIDDFTNWFVNFLF